MIAAALAVAVALVPQGADDLHQRYAELVTRYRDGDAEEAVAVLARWPLSECRAAAAGLPPADRSVGTWSASLAAAAIALHTEVALASRRSLRDAAADLHAELARDLLTDLRAHAGERGEPVATLGRTWSRALGHQLLSYAFVGRALDELEAATERDPADARLWLAVGSADELMATVGSQREGDPRSRGGRYDPPQVAYRRAEDAYRRALSLEPGLVRARLRLARTAQALGRGAEAIADALAQVVEAAPDSATVSLAHLFLGDLHESRGGLERAVAEYRTAVEVAPRSPSGQVALSHALQRSGDRRAAASWARAAVSVDGGGDVWLDYLAAVPELEQAMADLRRAAAPELFE